jgi:hypothetical protein
LEAVRICHSSLMTAAAQECVGVYIVAQTDINSTGTPECNINSTGTPECDINSTGTPEWYVRIFKYAQKIAPSCRDLDLV